jgi:hypothetical protein
MRGRVLAGLAGVVAVAAAAVVVPMAVAEVEPAAPQPISPGKAMYPRVIKLTHSGDANGRVMASVTSTEGLDGIGQIFESTDNGATFQQVGTIKDPDGAQLRGLCCGTLFELPRQVGDMPEGTLLWAVSTGYDVQPEQRHNKQRLWESRDHGRTWTFKSDIFTGPNRQNGFEPELSVSTDGHLVAHWADGSQPKYDQKISQIRSTDGVNWTDKRDTVINAEFEVRPGMPGIRQLADGTYFMVYEVCNIKGEPLCSSYFRTSADGWDYGDPLNLGTLIRTADGKYARHTPTLSVGPTGQLVFVSEMLVNADGSHAPGNGTTLLVNDNNGAGPWREIPAPVPVPNPNNEGCRNFSPSLLAAEGSVLQLAPEMVDGECRVLYATGPIPPPAD